MRIPEGELRDEVMVDIIRSPVITRGYDNQDDHEKRECHQEDQRKVFLGEMLHSVLLRESMRSKVIRKCIFIRFADSSFIPGMRSFKNILLSLVLLLLLFPLLQSRTGLVKEKRLQGFFQLKEKPSLWSFTWKGWLRGNFQEEYSQRLEDHTGFRNSFIRIRNQVDYSLFGISHATGFIREKQGYLIEEDYIHEYTGKYFIGKTTIDRKLDRLKEVIEKLKENHTALILVFEPGKASFFPEYIPERFHPSDRSLTNYEYILSGLRRRQIPFLDLNHYFLLMKDTSRYPLFPKYGMHWSLYGMWQAVDTLAKYIGKVSGTEIPAIAVRKVEVTDTLRGSDNDIGFLMNLVFPLPRTRAAYPVTDVEDNPAKRTLSALVIGDSYYVNIEQEVASRLFKKEEYWYYNSKVYPFTEDDNHPVYIDKSDLAGKLKQFDILLLTVSEINLHCMYWDFIDEAYLAFNPGEKDDPVYAYENKIRDYRDWFRFVVEKARSQQRPLERMIRADAEYMYGLENKKQ